MGGVAGEQVAAAGAVTGQQSPAVGDAPLDLGRVDGVGDLHDAVAVLVVPAETGDVVVGAVQDAADRGAGLRAPVGVPGRHGVAARPQPGGERGHPPVPDGPPRGLVRQRVDLQEQHTRGQGPVAGRPLHPAAGAAEEHPSSSTASRLLTTPATAAIVTATSTATRRSATTTPGTAKDSASTAAPSSRKLLSPRVKKASGSATRMTSGHTPAVSTPSSSAMTGACHHDDSWKPCTQRLSA